MDKKALIVWLWERWLQYVDFFFKNDYIVEGLCKSQDTQIAVQNQKNITVYVDIDTISVSNYSIIVLALPTDIQGSIALDILGKQYEWKLIIETPVSWDKDIISQLQTYKNVIFFMEEYFTLLSQFLRKINRKEIQDISVKVYIHKDDYNDEKAREVSFMHMRHNFLWMIDLNDQYDICFHESEKIYYTVSFFYRGKKMLYNFTDEKYLILWDKKYDDPFCFDLVLEWLISHNEDLKKYYTLEI